MQRRSETQLQCTFTLYYLPTSSHQAGCQKQVSGDLHSVSSLSGGLQDCQWDKLTTPRTFSLRTVWFRPNEQAESGWAGQTPIWVTWPLRSSERRNAWSLRDLARSPFCPWFNLNMSGLRGAAGTCTRSDEMKEQDEFAKVWCCDRGNVWRG